MISLEELNSTRDLFLDVINDIRLHLGQNFVTKLVAINQTGF
ncbi:MAG: hypothetical protein VYD54_10470 [Bdellovibrionota bacterium]|nr:hypothetical protein [Bdellovibrionota bacterium]